MVQTFMPYSDFMRSLECLDRTRLGNQRRETKSILTSLQNKSGWHLHRVSKMWAGYEEALKHYYNLNLYVWEQRGYKNIKCVPLPVSAGFKYPPWFGDERVHSSHRAALLAKNYAWYSRYDWKEDPEIDYFWPV